MSPRPNLPRVVAGGDVGRRALRNLLSFGGFVIAPLQVRLMSAALGPSGYGRWWWTFGILEAVGLVGMVGADLYIRRELPRLAEAGEERAAYETIGTAVGVGTLFTALIAAVQIALAGILAARQHDPELKSFLLLLAVQPVLWNLGVTLGAALQSLNVLGTLAVLRGIIFPGLQLCCYLACARYQLGAIATLWTMVGVSVLGVVMVAALFARHLSLGATLRESLRMPRLRELARFGVPLLPPALLWTVAGKLDLYYLGGWVDKDVLGVYAACLQLAALVPAVRTAFDPIAQTQIGALRVEARRAELTLSLQRMARLCAIGGGLPFAILLALGGALLSGLLHAEVAYADASLVVLAFGQLIGSIAIGAWLLPMTRAGGWTALVAAMTLVVKIALLVSLVPRLGVLGAAIATSVGTIAAQQGQAILGARWLPGGLYPGRVLLALGASCAAGALGRMTATALSLNSAVLWLAGAVTSIAFLAVLPLLLAPEDRAGLRAFVGLPVRPTENRG
jgi:O-antigen/teichoic acid export membrane protein